MDISTIQGRIAGIVYRLGLNNKQFSEKIGVKYPTLMDIVSGRKSAPSYLIKANIADSTS